MKNKMSVKIFTLVLTGFVLLFTHSCKKSSNTPEQVAQVPVLTTSATSNILQTTASCGGNITSDGDAAITARGVCWSTSQTPTTANSKTADGTGTGSFTSAITGLLPNTSYYVRAYATNSAGTSYGSAVSLITLPDAPSTVTDIDGNVYHTVTIGTQVWMVENLKTTKFRDGSAILNITDNTTWSNSTTAAYSNYNNIASNSDTYGRLYNRFAVTDAHNICPTGWHVPSDAEWNTLEKYLDNFVDITAIGWTGNSVGDKLKEQGTTHWLSGNNGYNSSGFTALPGGVRSNDGSYNDLTYGGYWWSASSHDAVSLWSRYLDYGSSKILRGFNNGAIGFSIRCIKD